MATSQALDGGMTVGGEPEQLERPRLDKHSILSDLWAWRRRGERLQQIAEWGDTMLKALPEDVSQTVIDTLHNLLVSAYNDVQRSR